MKPRRLLSFLLVISWATVVAGDDVSARKSVAGSPRQEYFLIDHSGGAVPRAGYRLLVVLPGGDGSAAFNPFVTNIGKQALGPEWLVAQLVAVKWTPDQSVVWPTAGVRVDEAEFTTEDFVGAVISDIGKSLRLDADHVYVLGWSSGGPAAYAASVEVDAVRGAFVAMSVFKPDRLPGLAKAKGRRYFLYHSREDAVCPFRMAEEANERLSRESAAVELITYDGGHGWHGDVFGALRTGLAWLQKR